MLNDDQPGSLCRMKMLIGTWICVRVAWPPFTHIGMTAEPTSGLAWLGPVRWCWGDLVARAAHTEMPGSSGGQQLPFPARHAGGWVRGPWCPAAWHPSAMDKALVPVRDLTDSDQNQ